MIRSVAAAVRQALSGKAFVLGVMGVVAVLFLSSTREIILALRSPMLLSSSFHHDLIINALSSNGMTMALPILAALPFTSSVVDDIKSGFVKEYLPRATLDGYCVGRASACALSGGLVFILGIFVAYATAAILFTPMEAALEGDSLLSVYLLELLEKGMLLFCSGAFWSMVGMLFAALTGSRYMAYASPFVLYYVLIILYERYFDRYPLLYPKEWVAPSDSWVFGNVGVILFVAELTVIAALCFGIVVCRRLSRI